MHKQQTYKSSRCQIKEYNFRQILRLSNGFITPKSRKFLLFDNNKLDNTKEIIQYFPQVKADRVTIIERNRTSYCDQKREEKKLGIQLGHHLHASFKDALLSFGNNLKSTLNAPLPDANIIYLDGTGSPFGNSIKKSYPMEELWELLCKSQVSKITLGVTFCASRIPKKYNNEKIIRTVWHMLEQQIFPSAQWKIVKRYVPRKTYTKTGAVVEMIFMVYNLERDFQIDPTIVDHYVTILQESDSIPSTKVIKRFVGFSPKYDII